MSFSDADLKRLKETFDRVVKDGFMIWAGKPTVKSDANDVFNAIPALLARLEAAEKERDFYLKKLTNIRALPERSPKCACFAIANKALKSHDLVCQAAGKV